jgi:hypothetical protein
VAVIKGLDCSGRASDSTAATTSASNTRIPGIFTGGTILGVAVDVSDQAYLDLEKEAARAFSLD